MREIGVAEIRAAKIGCRTPCHLGVYKQNVPGKFIGSLADSVSFLLGEGARYLIVSLNYAAPWQEEDFQALRLPELADHRHGQQRLPGCVPSRADAHAIADRAGRRLYKKRDPHFLHKHYNSAYPVLSLLEDVLSPTARPSVPNDLFSAR